MYNAKPNQADGIRKRIQGLYCLEEPVKLLGNF
jgi:hypothetical protein